MSKRPTELVYVGNIINHLFYLPDSFPRGLEVDLEESTIFSTLMLLTHINRLILLSHLYRCLFNYVTTWQGSWTGATALCIEAG